MIIRFYDNEFYPYPLLEIKDYGIEDLKNSLKIYLKEERYNFDDFINNIKNHSWYIRLIDVDEDIFF